MRKIAATVLATTLFASGAFAAELDSRALLSPGKPAGVRNAEMENNTLLIIAGVAIVAGGIALAASGDSNTITTASTGTTPSTTGTTSTTKTTTTTGTTG